MLSSEFLKETTAEIKRLELRARRQINSDMLGRYRSAFRGSGLVFSELREYQPGDEVRAIHWKASARLGKIYVKSYEEDRLLNIMLAVDISNSTIVGSKKSKHQKALELSALITLLAQRSQDRIGLCLFSDTVEEFLPAKKSQRQFKQVINALLAKRQLKPATDISASLKYLLERQKHYSVLFLISDFISPPFEENLRRLSKRHDVIGVQVEDPIDSQFPAVGLVEFTDAESGRKILLDTSSKQAQTFLAHQQSKRRTNLRNLFSSCKADFISIDQNPTRPLIELMQTRTLRH